MGHLQWFFPLHVIFGLFALAESYIKRLSTLYIINNRTKELFMSLMDLGWHQKIVLAKDIVRCIISMQILIFKYVCFHEAFHWHVVVLPVLRLLHL